MARTWLGVVVLLLVGALVGAWWIGGADPRGADDGGAANSGAGASAATDAGGMAAGREAVREVAATALLGEGVRGPRAVVLDGQPMPVAGIPVAAWLVCEPAVVEVPERGGDFPITVR